MQLLDHVSISVGNLVGCVDFYDAIMQALGCEKVYQTESSLGYGVRCQAGEENHSCLAVYESDKANTDGKRHWCFKANSREMVDRFYEAGIANGGVCDGGPGVRVNYHPNYYGAFLYDPAGNRVEAVFHGEIKT
jgi:catechol 2,3-dioxygenase-like lactoylglutathione lyase family enzyme